MAHKHSVYDTDLHFTIDKITRKISSQSGKVSLMQYDHNSERFTFELDRYVEGHDMMLCNVVEVHYINIDSANKRNTSEGVYPVLDLQLSPNDENVVIFSWLISQNATMYAGSLNFIVRFACVSEDEEATVDYQWWCDIYKLISIGTGMSNTDTLTNDADSDVLAMWKQEVLENTLPYVVATVETANDTLATLNQRVAETEFYVNFETGNLEYESPNYEWTINEETGNLEYVQVQSGSGVISDLIDRCSEGKADSVTRTFEGTAIVGEDSASDPMQGLRIFGKTTQAEGTLTPSAPIELKSITSPTVISEGKNLLHNTRGTATNAGITYTLNDDGSVTINGTATNTSYYTFDIGNRIPCRNVELVASYDNTDGQSSFVIGYFKEDGSIMNNIASSAGAEVKFQFPDEAYTTRSFLAVNAGVTLDNVTVYPMIRLANASTGYEAPTEERTIPIDRSLPGIPVDSNGNYTDADGQQWVCDEIDFERGVYIQRVKTLAIDDTTSVYNGSHSNGQLYAVIYSADAMISSPLMCNAYRTSAWTNEDLSVYCINSAIIITDNRFTDADTAKALLLTESPVIHYILATPVETELTTDELETYKSFFSHYPTTTVVNDCDAHMVVTYNADTTNYITAEHVKMEQKCVERIDELKALLVAAGVLTESEGS